MKICILRWIEVEATIPSSIQLVDLVIDGAVTGDCGGGGRVTVKKFQFLRANGVWLPLTMPC